MQAAIFWATDDRTLTRLSMACVSRDAAYAATFEVQKDRQRRRAAYGLVRYALNATGWAAENTLLDRYETGQPYFRQMPNLMISLSHSSVGVAIGLGLDCAVGVDIEAAQSSEDWRNIVPFVTSAQNVSPRNSLCIWTLSEACAKSHSLGLPALESAHLPLNLTLLDEPQRIVWRGLAARDLHCFEVAQGAVAYAISAGAKVTTRRV